MKILIILFLSETTVAKNVIKAIALTATLQAALNLLHALREPLNAHILHCRLDVFINADLINKEWITSISTI